MYELTIDNPPNRQAYRQTIHRKVNVGDFSTYERIFNLAHSKKAVIKTIV